MNEQVSVINVNIVSSHARLEMAPIRHASAHRHPHIQPRLDRTNFADNNGNRNRNEECSSEKWFTYLRIVPYHHSHATMISRQLKSKYIMKPESRRMPSVQAQGPTDSSPSDSG